MKTIPTSAILLLVAACAATARPVLHYAVPVELTGQLQALEQYGPPNFGESATTDLKVRVLVLRVNRPFDIAADTGNTADLDSLADIREVQLMPSSSRVFLDSSLVGRTVRVSGTLAQAVTAANYTRAMMYVSGISVSGMHAR